MAMSPVCLLRSTTACASRRESASGISTCTCLPAFMQAIPCVACLCLGGNRMTASTCDNARLLARSVATCGMPYLTATSLVASSWRPTSDITSTPSMFLMPSRCLMPNAPAPASATLIALAISVVLQDQMADGGVARGHVVEAVPHRRLLAAPQIAHRAARDQPHHELDALAAGFTDIFEMRHLRQPLGIVDQPVEELGVPFLVDQAGARALQLVAHAAGAPNLHVKRLVIGLDGLADRLPQHEAAPSRRRRILHHVD